MEFRILGPLEVVSDRRQLAVPGGRPRALLAMLLLSANRTVARERLVDGLWGDVVPDSGVKMVQIYVSRLRRVLPPSMLRTRPPGYLLELDTEQLDLHRFLRLAGEGRKALTQGNAGEASARLGEALALWRGPALREFAEPFAVVGASHLEELQLSALEMRIEADLMRGLAAELVGELELLASAHPLRERLRGQLMLSLYRSGRQAEALAVYDDLRRALDEQLGLHPGPALQQLQHAILRQDGSLAPPAGGGRPAASREVARGQEPSAGFFGRATELARLEAVLPTAATRSGNAVLIVGSPGIGKTRLAEELALRAEAAGATVAWGRCYAREAPPPYWPWRESIRALACRWTPEQLGDVAASDAATIARLVPELGARLAPARAEPAPEDPQQARFRLFDAVTMFFMRAAAREPLVVVLDDLHAADADSLSLLAFLARQLRDGRLLVVATLRDDEVALGHPLAEALGALRRAGGTMRLTLSGLAPAALAELVEAQVGSRPPADLVAELHDGTGGNPLFVAEVTRLALDGQTHGIEGDELLERFRAALPGGVRSAIAVRMSALSPACREALVAAALLGGELSIARLRALSGLKSADAVLDAAEEALTAGLLQEHAAQAGRYEFAHQLVREAVLGQLSATRRARLHLLAADALERLYGAPAEARAAEIAHHLEAAGGLAAPSRIVGSSRLGAARAMGTQAYAEAQRLFRQALAAKAGEPMDDETAELLLGLARAELATLGLHDAAGFRAAVESMRRAFDHHAATGDVARAVEVAALPVPPISRTTSAGEYRELTVRALALVAPGSLDAGRLLAVSGWFAGANEVDLGAAAPAFDAAIAIARRHGDAGLEMRTLLSAAHVDFQHTRWAECLAHAGAALELSRRARDPRAEVFARIWAGRSSMVLGDAAAAHAHLAAGTALAERLAEPYWINSAFLDATWLAVLEGRWDAARAASDRALAPEPDDTRALACRALVEYECGERRRGDEIVARLIEAHTVVGVEPDAVANNVVAAFLPLFGRLGGHGDERRAVAREAAARAQASAVLHPMSRLMVHTGLGLLAVSDADADAAAVERDVLSSQAGTAVLVATRSADRLLGQLAATCGDAGGAARHFEQALAFCRAAGYRPELAWTARDYAALPGCAKRERLLEESRAIARELAMVALLEHLEPARMGGPGQEPGTSRL